MKVGTRIGTLSQLWVYPVKSAAGIRLESSKVGLRGLEHDRRWMVVDPNNRLVTQRERPELALLKPSFIGETLRLGAEGIPGLELPLVPEPGEVLTVMMWKEPVGAQLVQAATDWVSTLLGGPYRLVYMPEAAQRTMAGPVLTPLSFVDGNPFLLISEASLADLNGRLAEPVDMRRFRPNLIVKGCETFAEDTWDTVQIGGQVGGQIGALELRRIGPSLRCMIVNVDPNKGERRAEPLRTLARYRRTGQTVQFGQNFRHAVSAPSASYPLISCGDPVAVKAFS